MPRMFDILRGKGKTPQKDSPNEENKEKNAAAPPLNFSTRLILIDAGKNKESENHSLLSKKLISTVRRHGIDNQEKTRESYVNAIVLIEAILERVRNNEDPNLYLDKIYSLLDEIFNQLVLGESILNNIYGRGKDEYYLPYHIVNTVILSLFIGINMGFNKSGLDCLGLAAIFYDLGMDALSEITSLPRKLSEEEYLLIRAHISKGLKLLEKISTISDAVKETIQMHHERENGKGYPGGIKSGGINPYAKIIGLVDTYEALTNTRQYRERINAHEAVKFILGSLKDYFDPEVMKVFLNKMSLYPIGSVVKLDTQELARVVSVQSGSPLRPVVMIIRHASGEPVQERRVIDLSKQDSPSIQEPV